MLLDEPDWKDDGTVSCWKCGERIDQLRYIDHIFDDCDFRLSDEEYDDYERLVKPPVPIVRKVTSKREKKKAKKNPEIIVPITHYSQYGLSTDERREIAEREAEGIGAKNDTNRSTLAHYLR